MKQEQTNQALAALVRRARDGDRAAAEALYQQSYPALYRTVRAACRDEATAADVLQESYIQALTHLDELRRPARFLPWIKRIAVNELRQQLRRKQPTLFSELPAEGDSLPEPVEYDTPEARLEKKEDAEQIRQLLNCLPDGQRTVLILYYCEQYSVKEIAEQLGVSQSTVKSQLHHGRKRLESELQKLEKRGVRLLGAAAVPLLLRRMTAAQNVPPAGAYPACELAPAATSLTAKTGAALLPRVLATAATLAVIGGAAVGVGLAVRAHTGKTAEETAPIYMDAERPKPVEPTEEPTEKPTEEPTEEPPEDALSATPSEEARTLQNEADGESQTLPPAEEISLFTPSYDQAQYLTMTVGESRAFHPATTQQGVWYALSDPAVAYVYPDCSSYNPTPGNYHHTVKLYASKPGTTVLSYRSEIFQTVILAVITVVEAPSTQPEPSSTELSEPAPTELPELPTVQPMPEEMLPNGGILLPGVWPPGTDEQTP